MSFVQGERRIRLQATRAQLYSLPLNVLFELPGRPHVVYQLRSYAAPQGQGAEEAAALARADLPFLFKAFESGQIGPKRMSKMHGGKPRIATIHEYLDWTITAAAAEQDDELVSGLPAGGGGLWEGQGAAASQSAYRWGGTWAGWHVGGQRCSSSVGGVVSTGWGG
jgi:hypothetical protein